MQLELRKLTPAIAPTTGLTVAPFGAVSITSTEASAGLRLVGRLGLLSAGLAAIALGCFIASTHIAGAVMTNGTLVVDAGTKQVQPEWGGVVAKVLIHNGDLVVAGQILVQLDKSVATAKLASAYTLLLQNQARLARLVAERDDTPLPSYDSVISDGTISKTDLAAILQTELNQFSSRRDALNGQLAKLDEQIDQVDSESQANAAQLDAVLAQITLLDTQLKGLRHLLESKLVTATQVSASELSLIEARGNEGRLRAGISSDKGKLAELSVTKIQIEREWRADVANQIAQVQSSNPSLVEQVAVARDELQRLAIRAPLHGIVHQLASMAPGTVVQPAEKLMLIVPDQDRLVAEVKIRPSDIDQLYPSQPVDIQLSAFERATTPIMPGELTEISADLIQDARTGASYYTARIAIDSSAQPQPGLKLVPGMPVEAFIHTDDRTILSYLTKPLTDQMNRAFR